MSVALGVVVGALLGEPLLDRLMPTRSRVTRLAISGNQVAPGAELAALSGLEPGTRLSGVDVAAVGQALLAHPWVREARVASLPPDRVIVEVAERQPVAVALLGDGSERRYVDADGVAFAPASEGLTVPLLVGAQAADATSPDPLLIQGVALLAAVHAQGLPAPGRVELSAEDPHTVPALVWRDPKTGAEQRVLLGDGDPVPKLARLARLEAAGLPEVERAAELDLRFRDQVVVREAAAGEAASEVSADAE